MKVLCAFLSLSLHTRTDILLDFLKITRKRAKDRLLLFSVLLFLYNFTLLFHNEANPLFILIPVSKDLICFICALFNDLFHRFIWYLFGVAFQIKNILLRTSLHPSPSFLSVYGEKTKCKLHKEKIKKSPNFWYYPL